MRYDNIEQVRHWKTVASFWWLLWPSVLGGLVGWLAAGEAGGPLGSLAAGGVAVALKAATLTRGPRLAPAAAKPAPPPTSLPPVQDDPTVPDRLVALREAAIEAHDGRRSWASVRAWLGEGAIHAFREAWAGDRPAAGVLEDVQHTPPMRQGRFDVAELWLTVRVQRADGFDRVLERWRLVRSADQPAQPVADALALACPVCGGQPGALTCTHCGTSLEDGAGAWQARTLEVRTL